MNNISEQILGAIDTIVDKKLTDYKSDLTVQATIDSIVNLDIGEYKVKYNGNIFSAFANVLTDIFGVGDEVYLKIPAGDLSNKKIIEGKISNKSLSEIELSKLRNTISPVGPEWQEFFKYQPNQTYGICAGSGDSKKIFEGKTLTNARFMRYSSQYEYFKISAKFQTKFYNVHTKGNYGLKIVFAAGKNGQSEVDYILDLSNFNGDPYRFTSFAEQSVVIQVQKNYLTGLKSIEFIQSGFDYDLDKPEGGKEILHDNIFVKDISIQFIEFKNLIDNLYYLRFNTPYGLSFIDEKDGEEKIELTGQLIHNGESILNRKNSVCNWYERDLRILPEDTNYNKEAGFGWRPLVSTSDANINFNKLTVSEKIVKYEKEYKLVVTYKDNTVLSETAVISNINAGFPDIILEQKTVGDHIELVVNVPDGYSIQWYASYPENDYEKLDCESEIINVNEYLKYEFVTFYCSIYKDNDIIAIREHTIFNTKSQEDVVITYIGQDAYQYDVNGDITIEDSEKERTLECLVAWKEGLGANYVVNWYAPDGQLLKKGGSEEKKDPENSMIANLWLDNNNIFHYTVKQKYRINYNNNTIKIEIITDDEKVYTFYKEILFLKDGDQGTNGSTYIVAIRPADNNGSKLSGFQALNYSNNNWGNALRLRAYVYRDGELLNSNDNYTLSYTWEGTNIGITSINGKPDTVNVQGKVTSFTGKNSEFYIKIQVDIRDEKNNLNTIHALYPIDVLIGTNIDKSKVDISSLPSYIKYTSSGVTPSYYNNNIQFLYNDVEKDIESLNQDLLKIDIKEQKKYLRPVTNFIFEDKENQSSIGVLKCKINGDKQYILHSIVMYLDNYGNEAINGWDGTKLKIDENGKYILAPQIGAGSKDSSNKFTGVIMGKDTAQKQIGLYGYDKGITSFGLMSNGTAFFGAEGKGRITIDGNSALIYGGLSKGQANSMVLTLANTDLKSSTKAIEIKDSKGRRAFSVNYAGEMFANLGEIGDWEITDDTLSGGNTILDSEYGITTNLICIDDKGTIGYGSDDLLGIFADSDETISLRTEGTMLMKSDDYQIAAKSFHLNVPKNEQTGIYARFA